MHNRDNGDDIRFVLLRLEGGERKACKSWQVPNQLQSAVRILTSTLNAPHPWTIAAENDFGAAWKL